MAKQEFSISRLAELIPTETDAYKFLEELRWGGEPPACPKCGVVGDTYFIQPANGSTRRTRTGSMSPRRVWRCRACKKQFSVLTDTLFHGTRIPVRTWIFVIFDFCSAKNSMSAWEVSRKYEITNESAWHMLHRIREVMKREPLAALFSGTVASDETYIGGKPSNRSKSARAARYAKTGGNYATSDKTIVLALVDTDSREVRSRVIADVKKATPSRTPLPSRSTSRTRCWSPTSFGHTAQSPASSQDTKPSTTPKTSTATRAASRPTSPRASSHS
jgi:transposase-like protein